MFCAGMCRELHKSMGRSTAKSTGNCFQRERGDRLITLWCNSRRDASAEGRKIFCGELRPLPPSLTFWYNYSAHGVLLKVEWCICIPHSIKSHSSRARRVYCQAAQRWHYNISHVQGQEDKTPVRPCTCLTLEWCAISCRTLVLLLLHIVVSISCVLLANKGGICTKGVALSK